jgi:hypothetical protein
MTTYSRPRSPGRTGRRLLIAVLVLIGLLVAADRIADAVAERAAGTLLQRSQHLDQRPDVDITGFPFLTQLVARQFDEIDVHAHDVAVGESGHTVRLHQLDVAMHDVHVSGNFDSATSGSSTATGVIRYADLSGTLGVPVSYAGDHRITAQHRETVAGAQVTATATVGVQLSDDHVLSFTHPQVSVAGQSVPPQLTNFFGEVFRLRVPLQGLPFGVQVQAVQLQPDGLHITLSAGRLTFRR